MAIKPRGVTYNRIRLLAKAHNMSERELMEQLVERLVVSRQPLIVRDRDSGAGRALARPNAAPRRENEDVIVYESRIAATFRHLQENFDSIDFDELLK